MRRYLERYPSVQIEIFGYGSGGAQGIISWLSACSELGIRAVGVFDGDPEGLMAYKKASAMFADSEDIMVLQIPTPDIRDKHKLAPDCKTELDQIDKEGLFNNKWELKPEYKEYLDKTIGEISEFLSAEVEEPPISFPQE